MGSPCGERDPLAGIFPSGKDESGGTLNMPARGVTATPRGAEGRRPRTWMTLYNATDSLTSSCPRMRTTALGASFTPKYRDPVFAASTVKTQ